jgi:xanthine dehydrogenase accessory factor
MAGMKDILTALDRWQRDGETIAVATLVRACGSVPRLPGARLVMTRSGKMVGSVSGGCVENDVCEHARQVLDSGRPIIVHYDAADPLGLAPLGLDVGLSCGGSIDVLIEPFAAAEAWQALCRAVQHERAAALAIGLTPPAIIGRKLVVFDDGTAAGSVDAVLDDHVTARAQRLTSAGGTHVLSLPWSGDTASVFLEAFPAPQRLFIVGATHTAMPLCRLAKVLGFQVTVIDPRNAYATPERFPDADALLHVRPDEALAGSDSTYVVILTHDPKFDLPALTSALRARVRYIGILGSRRTHERRKAELRQQGFTEADMARIRAPIGLDLGARTPEEIALAILAEMLAVRYGRNGGSLADCKAAILGAPKL